MLRRRSLISRRCPFSTRGVINNRELQGSEKDKDLVKRGSFIWYFPRCTLVSFNIHHPPEAGRRDYTTDITDATKQ